MIKEQLKKEYIKALEVRLSKARHCYEVAKKDTIEAEGRMVTRYDSTKTETAWLADGYLRDVKELENVIAALKEEVLFANLGDVVKVDIYKKNKFEETERLILDADFLKDKRELLAELVGTVVNESVTETVNGENVEYHVRGIEVSPDIEGVRLNSLVELEDEDGCAEYYYLVNHIGGIELEIDGYEVFCISKQAPMALALLGKKVGEMVVPNPEVGYKYVVKRVE